MLAVIGAAALVTGCTTHAAGTPKQAAYRPPPLDSITGRMADPVEGALAYALDGAAALVWNGDRHTACVQPGDRCLTLPHDVTPGFASFAPDGRHFMLAESISADFRGRLWIQPVTGGRAEEIPAPSGCGRNEPDASGAAPTGDATPTGGADTTTAPTSGAPATPASGTDASASYVDALWLDSSTLLAVDVDADRGSCLVRVSTNDPRPEPVAVAPDGGVVYPPLVAEGGVAVAGLAVAYHAADSLLVVDLKTGASRTITIDGASIGLSHVTRVMAMDISPDGRTVLVKAMDDVNFEFVELASLDLETSSLTPFQGWEAGDGDPPWSATAATFSPDGSEVIVVATQDSDSSALLAGRSAGGSVTHLADVPASALAIGRLTWTATDLVVPGVAAGASPLLDLAPIQLTG